MLFAVRQKSRLIRDPRVVSVTLLVVLLLIYASWAFNWWNTASEGFDGWGTGEWLLSYDGGFVRRGLFGSLVLFVTPMSMSIATTVALSQLALMGALFALLFGLFMRTDRSPVWAMVILSPAVLLYPTIVFANQQAGPRKELLTLVALGCVAMGFARKSWFWWGSAGLVSFAVATWSHEASALLLPAFLYLVWVGSRETSPQYARYGLLLAFALVGASALLLSVLFPGNAEIQIGICSAWAERGIDAACDQQALGALTLTPAASTEWFRTQLFPRYWEYLPIAVLASVPLFAVRFLPAHWKLTTVILLFLAPLFYIAWDYGRWIVLAATALSILALTLSTVPKAPGPMKVPLIAIAAYILLWGFPGYSNEPPVMFDGWIVTWLKTHLPTAWY